MMTERLTLLTMESDEAFGKNLRKFLEGCGFEVFEAGDRQSGLVNKSGKGVEGDPDFLPILPGFA